VHLPVILVTGDTDLTDRVYGLEHGADDYLTKPVAFDELVARARAQLRRRSPDDGIRQFVEAANDAFVAWDGVGAITEWTSQAESLFGWTRDEVLGESFAMVVLAPRYRLIHALRMERFECDDTRPTLGTWFELTALRRDGREIPIEMTVWSVVHDERRTFNAFVRDLSRRFEIEDALRDRARLQAIVDGVNDVIVLTDLAGVIVYTSPSAPTVLGFDADDLAGRQLVELVHPEDRDAVGRAFDAARELGAELVKEQRVRTAGGDYLWMDMTAAAVRELAGNVSGFEFVARDVTTTKLADSARKRATCDLARMVMDLRSSLDHERDVVAELQTQLNMTNALLEAIPHQLRAPITSIRAYVDRLADAEIAERAESRQCLIDVVRRDSRFAVDMIENLHTIAGVESGRLALERSAVELRPIVARAVEAMQPRARERQVTLTTDLSPCTGLVLADEQQLERVLTNLFANAIAFNRDGGTVAVSTRRLDAEVEVVVADSGIGIPPEEHGGIFTPFFRSSLTTEHDALGSGLGLVVVRHLVDLHEGTIAVHSAPGSGTTVRFTLPYLAQGSNR
jgi:PAS domain S-box-containing protein